MFSRYWRSYPWWLQLVLFTLMIFILLSLAQVLLLWLVPLITGVPIADILGMNEKSNLQVVQATLLVTAISTIFVFLLPPLLFANLAHPKPMKYLGLVKPGKAIQPLLSIIAILAALPLILSISYVIHLIGLGSNADAIQAAYDDKVKVFMSKSHEIGLGLLILVMAVLPGLSEEIFFRGMFMRFAKKRSNNMVMPIALSAIAFALTHQTPYSFLSIFFAGVGLAVIYNLTGSLWCSILAHMTYNASQLVLEYYSDNAALKTTIETNSVPVSVLIIGTAISAAAFYLLWKFRTPLPPTWADDYTEEELSEKAV